MTQSSEKNMLIYEECNEGITCQYQGAFTLIEPAAFRTIDENAVIKF